MSFPLLVEGLNVLEFVVNIQLRQTDAMESAPEGLCLATLQCPCLIMLSRAPGRGSQCTQEALAGGSEKTSLTAAAFV